MVFIGTNTIILDRNARKQNFNPKHYTSVPTRRK